jgi:hypothetical protein
MDLNTVGDKKMATTIARFATLLVNLSEQSDKVSQENLERQRKLVYLTWGLFWLTLGLTLVAVVQIYLAFKSDSS